jgi:hypothetical protein
LAVLGYLALSHGASERSLGHELQTGGIPTVGTVTAAEPSNHHYFSYSYTVEGSQYSGDTNSFMSAQTVHASQLQVVSTSPLPMPPRTPSSHAHAMSINWPARRGQMIFSPSSSPYR